MHAQSSPWTTFLTPTVAALALLFTAASFWWLQARRGRITVFEPSTFAGYVHPADFRVRLPLAFYNTGARAIPIVDLRLTVPASGRSAPAQTFRKTVKPGEGDISDVARPFAVPGRQVVVEIVEFGATWWAPPDDLTIECSVEICTDRGEWETVLVTSLAMPAEAEARRRYIAHHRSAEREGRTPLDPEPHRATRETTVSSFRGSKPVVCPVCGMETTNGFCPHHGLPVP